MSLTKEEYNRRCRERYATDYSYRENILRSGEKYRKKFPERKKAADKRYKEENPEVIEKWKKLNPDYWKEWGEKGYVKKKKSDINYQMNAGWDSAKNRGGKWTIEEEIYLLNNQTSPKKDLADFLGRSYRSVTTKLNRLKNND